MSGTSAGELRYCGYRQVGTLMTLGVEKQEVIELDPYRIRASCCEYT